VRDSEKQSQANVFDRHLTFTVPIGSMSDLAIYQQLRLKSYPKYQIIDSVVKKPLVLCDLQRQNYAHAFSSRKAERATHAGGLEVSPYGRDGSCQDHYEVGDMDDGCRQGEPNERQPRCT